MLTIYGKPSCTFCTLAVDYCRENNIQFDYIDLSNNSEKLEALKKEGFRTVPIIYDGDDWIGGYHQLIEKF